MNINEWRNFLAENKSEKLLREVTEDELGHIQQALDEMGNEDLAFNKIFDGKMRVLLDFKTRDTKSDLGRFVELFKTNGYEVDWAKGMISGTQSLENNTPENLTNRFVDDSKYIKPTPKKIQMKIGKYFKKILDLVEKREVLFDKIKAFAEENTEKYGRVPEGPGAVTGVLEVAALDEQELTNYRRAAAYLHMYMPETRGLLDRDRISRLAKYWAEHAEYIKNKVDTLENDKYSIIITRHPIDILRMSDFDSITSCHSPPSRGSGESYYKCAVAEAHGHGAVAYVVHTDQLKEFVEGPDMSIEEVEEEIQTGEIFGDPERWDATPRSLDPISRVRLRQVRYYEATRGSKPRTDDYKKADRNPFDGIQLAVPEKRVYGEKIPGIRDRIMQWVTEAQQEQMQIVRKDSEPDNDQRVIQLDKFIKFGGSYEDNHISDLIADLFGNEGGDDLPANTSGRVVQDTTTEDELDANLVGGLMEQYEHECGQIADRWNYRYAITEVSYRVEDDGGGSVYIATSAAMEIKWDLDEWNTLPNYMQASYAVSELQDIGWGWADDSGAAIRRVGDEVRMIIPINIEMVPDTNGMGFSVDPDDFEDFCTAINAIDDYEDGIKEYLNRFFKREGYLAGGALGTLAREILDGDIDTEWDLETDDRYDWDEVTQIDATAKFDFGAFDPPLPDKNPQIELAIANDRDFQISVRKLIHQSAQQKMNTGIYVNTHWKVYTDASNDVIMECNLRVNDYGSDEQVNVLEQILDDHSDLDYFRDESLLPLVLQALNSRLPSSMQQNLDENERIVKSWKSFLKG